MKLKVYSRQTLQDDEIRRILPQANVSFPVQRQDIHRDLIEKFNIIVLIDGQFHQASAVSCGEILDALRCGIRIYGTSCMGALKARELHSYGMIGHGQIFEMIRKQIYFHDDHWAQVYSPKGEKITPHSMSYIDFHFNVAAWVSHKRLTAVEGEILLRSFSHLYYTDRHATALNTHLKKKYPKRPYLQEAAEQLLKQGFSQKKRDAIATLKLVAKDLEHIRHLNAIFQKGGRQNAP